MGFISSKEMLLENGIPKLVFLMNMGKEMEDLNTTKRFAQRVSFCDAQVQDEMKRDLHGLRRMSLEGIEDLSYMLF